MLVRIASAANEPHAAMIRGALAQAGIASSTSGPALPQFGPAGPCVVLVEEHDAARARAILDEREGGGRPRR